MSIIYVFVAGTVVENVSVRLLQIHVGSGLRMFSFSCRILQPNTFSLRFSPKSSVTLQWWLFDSFDNVTVWLKFDFMKNLTNWTRQWFGLRCHDMWCESGISEFKIHWISIILSSCRYHVMCHVIIYSNSCVFHPKNDNAWKQINVGRLYDVTLVCKVEIELVWCVKCLYEYQYLEWSDQWEDWMRAVWIK